MKDFRRYAIYYAPRPGTFASAVAAWLGWDAARGLAVAQPDLPGLPRALADLTTSPHKYGFHGTIKAPFRLADGVEEAALRDRLGVIATDLAPAAMPGLVLHRMGGFLALVPLGDATALMQLAAEVVTRLDDLRAPLSVAEIARRRPDRLTPRQRDLLDLWGYPYVMDEFRFHLTLSDELPAAEADAVKDVAARYLDGLLPAPFAVQDLCLFGEAADGQFHLLHRYALTG